MRYAAQYITCGHFDAVPGELRLKAYGSRIMISFLAICLRALSISHRPSESLQLCYLMMTRLSNWCLDLETYPIELSPEQAQHLYDTGKESLMPESCL